MRRRVIGGVTVLLNRDRSELTLWRTLNVRRPDGAPDKIDCGNRAAVVYRRQPKP